MIGPLAERAQWELATARLDDFQPLLPAEQEVVARLVSGNYDRLGDGSRPETPDPSRVVRASLLRISSYTKAISLWVRSDSALNRIWELGLLAAQP